MASTSAEPRVEVKGGCFSPGYEIGNPKKRLWVRVSVRDNNSLQNHIYVNPVPDGEKREQYRGNNSGLHLDESLVEYMDGLGRPRWKDLDPQKHVRERNQKLQDIADHILSLKIKSFTAALDDKGERVETELTTGHAALVWMQEYMDGTKRDEKTERKKMLQARREGKRGMGATSPTSSIKSDDTGTSTQKKRKVKSHVKVTESDDDETGKTSGGRIDKDEAADSPKPKETPRPKETTRPEEMKTEAKAPRRSLQAIYESSGHAQIVETMLRNMAANMKKKEAKKLRKEGES